MAGIPYQGNQSWPADIELLDTAEMVLGGIDGPDNRPLKQLADRSAELKRWTDQVAAALGGYPHLAARMDALGVSGDAALDALLTYGPRLVAEDIAALRMWDVVSGVPADDTIDLTSSADLEVEQSYWLVDGEASELVRLASVVTAERVRAEVDLTGAYAAPDGRLSRTDGVRRYVSRLIDYVVLTVHAEGTGAISVWREETDGSWTAVAGDSVSGWRTTGPTRVRVDAAVSLDRVVILAADQPGSDVYVSDDWTFPTMQWFNIFYQHAAVIADDGLWNDGMQRWDITSGGLYIVNGAFKLLGPMSENSEMTLEIYRNGEPLRRGTHMPVAASTSSVTVGSVEHLGVGDFVHLMGYQNTGVSQTIQGGAVLSWGQIRRIG